MKLLLSYLVLAVPLVAAATNKIIIPARELEVVRQNAMDE
jgi:hypothetical protein